MASFLRSRRALKIVAGALALFFFALVVLPELILERLWMEALGYEPVFWKALGFRIALFVAAFVVTGLYLGGNLFYMIRQLPPLWASKWAREGEAPRIGEQPLTRGRLRVVAGALAGLIALAYAASFGAQWDGFVRFISAQTFGEVDPIFGNDVAFYLLQLPYIEVLHGAFVSLVFLTLFIIVTGYFLMGEVEMQHGQLRVRPSVVRHIAVNLILLLVGWAVGYFLDRYELMLTPGDAVYGADYIDVTVMIPALWIMVIASLALAVVVGLNMQRYRFKLLAYSAAGYVALMIVALVLVPSLVRQLHVQPNELSLETPYLEHNIAFTQMAYGVDEVDEREYDVDIQLGMDDVQNNQEAIDNIRLWDPRLLLETYRQIQEIRTYYQFYDVDIDRYWIDEEYKQVMVSPRELAQQLPGRVDSWQNRHLQYTHGYGSVMNLVAQSGEEGTPELIIRDLPPVTEDARLQVTEPAIYYGEETGTYNIVNTSARELDYPAGDQNVYTRYTGTGGVLLRTFWHELLFSWYFGDYNILLSDYIEPESRIQFWNRIQDRVSQIAPFLELDGDPYFVLGDERQYWIQDAYTTARHFPYSEQSAKPNVGRINYIRNSVKVVIDAYDGTVNFYVMDEQDPVLGAYRDMFPELFQPLEEMPENVRDHVRYPQDMFELQVEIYNRYHMTDPQVFYNNEDLWTRPLEHYGGREILMDPYFVLASLPGEEQLEFLLISPATPEGRDNMIGWIGARSDFPDYGQLVVYQLPKDRLIYGPNQVEARIDQDTEISRQLALWDQRGSRVIRGNLIVVPIERTFLYVEPVFLIAEGAQIPQMQRVIVSHGERVAMERTLDESLAQVLSPGLAQRALPLLEEGEVPVMAAAGSRDIREARDAMQRAREALQRGDFAAFGEEFEALQDILENADTDAPVDEELPPPTDDGDAAALPQNDPATGTDGSN